MTIGVIMPVYNESITVLKRSIHSILTQSYSSLNLIIIDDNPKSVNIKSYLQKLSHLDNRIKLIFNSKSIGPALSRNKGIKYSHDDLIAIMDADDISDKNRFYLQIKFMKKYNLDFVFSNCRDFGYHCINKQNISFNYKIVNQNLLKYIFSHYYDCAVHSGWMLKKSIYIKLHGYRNLEHGEDYDFIIRSLIHGYLLGYQPQVLIFKRKRKHGVSNNNQLKQFKISLILKKYARKYNYTYIIPLRYIYKMQNNLKSDSIKKFNDFLQLGHDVKYNLNLFNLIKFIFIILTSSYSLRYLWGIFYKRFCKRRIYHIIHRDIERNRV